MLHVSKAPAAQAKNVAANLINQQSKKPLEDQDKLKDVLGKVFPPSVYQPWPGNDGLLWIYELFNETIRACEAQHKVLEGETCNMGIC